MYNRNSNSNNNKSGGMYAQPMQPLQHTQQPPRPNQQQPPPQTFTPSPYNASQPQPQPQAASQPGSYSSQYQYDSGQPQQASASLYQPADAQSGAGGQSSGAYGYGQAAQGSFGYSQGYGQSSYGMGGGMGVNQMAPPQNLNQFAGQFMPENMMENPVMQVGLAQTQKAMGETMDKLAPGMTGMWGTLKFYFAVDGTYVLNKLKLILFPYRHKHWKRQGTQGDGSDKFAPPILDVNCPDLYIPLMAILTHTLVLSLLKGQYMKFTPEVISDTLSSSLLALFLECVAIIGGNWTLQSKGGVYSYMEVAIFSSYKYVGVAINMLVGLFLGFTGFAVVTLYTSLASAFFLCKSLGSKLPLHVAKRTRLFLAILAVLDFVIVVYLSYSSEFGKDAVNPLSALQADISSPSAQSADTLD